MIQIDQIKPFFPTHIRNDTRFHKFMLKEYLHLLILDYLATTPYLQKSTFIGGTNLRLVKGIDRFSEDLDFDCKDFSPSEFHEMTDNVLVFLQRSGWKVEPRDQINPKLSAFRRNLYFPELLFDLGLSGHREERFLIKIECQDQGIDYQREFVNINGCGFFFPFPVPSDGVLCSMKIAALLNRAKGRDFYDVMFLLAQTAPDYDFLQKRCGINDLQELKVAVAKLLSKIDLNQKKRDFERLLFNMENSKKILLFDQFVHSLV